MKSPRITGLTLIVGALAMIGGIGVHPHRGPDAPGAEIARQNLVVAVVVLASYGVVGVGLLRLVRSTTPQLWSDVASVTLALAGICGSLAAIAGHLVVPRLNAQLIVADHADRATVDYVVAGVSTFSAALAQASFANWAVGVLGLSIAMLHSSRGWKIVGAGGIALGLTILATLALGRLQIRLHDVGLVVLGSGTWLIAVGAGLCAGQPFAELRPRAPVY